MSKSFLKRLKANPEYFEFWEDLHDYCKDLHIPNKQEFVDTLPILYKRIKNDGAGHDIFQGLNKFAIEKPEDAIDILARIEKKGTREVLEFSASILSGLSQSETTYSYENKILEFVKSKDENKIYSGIEAAYRMRFKDKKEEVKFLNLIHIKIKGNRKSKSARCLGITTRFYNKHLNTIEEAKAIIIYLLESKNFSVQSEVARSLNEEFKPDEDIEHFKKCLNLLTYTDTKHQGIYSTIRFRLKEITKSHPNIILDFIEIWVLNNKENLKSISALEGVIEELYITNPETLKKMFLDWLNSDNSLYKYAVPFIISNLKF